MIDVATKRLHIDRGAGVSTHKVGESRGNSKTGNSTQCYIGMREVWFLGHVVITWGIATDPENV